MVQNAQLIRKTFKNSAVEVVSYGLIVAIRREAANVGFASGARGPSRN